MNNAELLPENAVNLVEWMRNMAHEAMDIGLQIWHTDCVKIYQWTYEYKLFLV